jgi:CRP/FNR family transcriptional regulator
MLGVDDLEVFLKEHPGAAFPVITSVCRLFRRANRKQLDFGSLDTQGRVARQLSALAEEFGVPDDEGNIRIDLPLTHADLAAWVGSSREAVGRAVQRLRTLGVIDNRRRTVVVVDAKRLAELGR